jgi:Zn-dependent protease
MFIPGIGALVRLKQHPPTESMDADIGLAGPLWGLGAAIAALGLHFVTGSELWTTIAWGGALINVFNLLPVWQLDGGRGFNAMSRHHRWIALGVLLIGWFISHNPIFVLLVLVAAGRALTAPAKVPDRKALVTYAGLVIAFSFLLRLHQPG